MSRSTWTAGSAPSTETRRESGRTRPGWCGPPVVEIGTSPLTATAGASARWARCPGCARRRGSPRVGAVDEGVSSIASIGDSAVAEVPPDPEAFCALRWMTNAMPSAAPTISTVVHTKGSTTFCRCENHRPPATIGRRQAQDEPAPPSHQGEPAGGREVGEVDVREASCARRSRGAADEQGGRHDEAAWVAVQGRRLRWEAARGDG